MAKEFLDGPDVGPSAKRCCGEGMPEGVTAGPLGEPDSEYRELNGFVDGTFVQVMAAPDSGARFGRQIAGRKDMLPAPVGGSVLILA